jgi:hypothetical protein
MNKVYTPALSNYILLKNPILQPSPPQTVFLNNTIKYEENMRKEN